MDGTAWYLDLWKQAPVKRELNWSFNRMNFIYQQQDINHFFSTCILILHQFDAIGDCNIKLALTIMSALSINWLIAHFVVISDKGFNKITKKGKI